MRILPFLSSQNLPDTSGRAREVELRVEGGDLAPWFEASRADWMIHALHIPDQAWTADPACLHLEALRKVGADFLVLQTPAPGNLLQRSALLRHVEMALEVLSGRGPRVVLRADPGALPDLVTLLEACHGEALGFCWDWEVGAHLDLISHRIHCAVARPGDDLEPLRQLGYRWNVAVEGTDGDRATLAQRFEDPGFPSLSLPPLPEVDLRWGSAWGGQS